jgi:hypothetical protein
LHPHFDPEAEPGIIFDGVRGLVDVDNPHVVETAAQ